MMIKQLMSVIAVCSLSACTAYIKENTFITQDENIADYSAEEVSALQEKFPKFKVKPITTRAPNTSESLHGIMLDTPASKDMIIFIPGNGMSVKNDGEYSFERLQKMNRDIVFFDRRGLGASEGNATVAQLGEDAVAKFKFLKETFEPTSVVVHGFSLGSFVAGHLAKVEDIDGLVLEGSATNVDEWIDESMPWYAKLFMTIEVDEPFYTIDNHEVVSKHYSGPLLVIGAEDDEQAPVELTSRLYDASISENKKLIIVEDAGHGEMLDTDAVLNQYKAFLNSLK